MRTLCAVVLLILAACGRNSNQPVRLVTYSVLTAWPFHLARELGHFRDEGLQVDFEEIASGAKAIQAVMGGSADVVTSGMMNAVIVATTGGQLTSFFNLTDAEGNLLVGSPSKADRIQRLADLKGASIGVGALGSYQVRVLLYYLKRSGLSSSDVQLISVGLGPAAVAAAEHGNVDAVVLGGMDMVALKVRAPGIRNLLDPRSSQQSKELFGLEAFPGALGLSATSQWLSQNPDKARRLARAMNRTLRWIREHSPGDVLSRIPVKLRNEERPLYLEQLQIAIRILSAGGKVPPGGPEAVQRVLAASLESAKSIDLAATWTNDFLEATK